MGSFCPSRRFNLTWLIAISNNWYPEKAADIRRYNKVCILFGKPASKSDISYSVNGRKQKGTRETFGKVVMFFLRAFNRASWQILTIKPTRCTNFWNLFWNKTLHALDSSFAHHQEVFTVDIAMVYVVRVCCVYNEKLLMMDKGTVRNM